MVRESKVNMLAIKNLSKVYRNNASKVEAVKDITIDIKDKEFVVFVGPSGCGKTTLLKCIAGILNTTKGEVKLENTKIVKPNMNIGMVFQDFSLFPWLTVKENIEFGLNIRNVSAKSRNEMLNHYLDITGLMEFKDTYPKDLSGGMQQRTAIARTLANNPRIILMDEPFGSLDNITRSSMQEFLTNLWEKQHKTIIFVTHDIEEAIFLADRIIVLSKRPATIIKEFKVPFKRPRIHELKHKQKFFAFKNSIAKFLSC